MGVTSDLTAGIAALLAAAGVGAWHPDGVYTATETGITDTVVPASPDRLIVLTVYDTTDDPTQADRTARLQVRTRAGRDPRTSSGLQDDVFAVLHNLPRQDVGGRTLAGCWRRSGPAPIGPDSNGRHEHSSNYELLTTRPATNPTT